MIAVLPFMLLFPDILIATFNKVFYPSPADVLMRHYKGPAGEQSVAAAQPFVQVKGVSI